LTADADTEDEQMDDAPASLSPNISDGDEIQTDQKGDLLAYHGMDRHDSIVPINISISVHRAVNF